MKIAHELHGEKRGRERKRGGQANHFDTERREEERGTGESFWRIIFYRLLINLLFFDKLYLKIIGDIHMAKILKSLSGAIENEYKKLSDGRKSVAIRGAIFFISGVILIWIIKALSDAGVSQVTSLYKTAWAMGWGMILTSFVIFIVSFKKAVFRYFFIFVFCLMFLVFTSESEKILMPELQFLFSSKVKNIFFYGLLVSGALALYHFQKKKKNENK